MVQLDMNMFQGITILFSGGFPTPGFVLTIPVCLEFSPSSLGRPGVLDFMCTFAAAPITTECHLHGAVVHQEGCEVPVQEPANKAMVL